MISFCCVHFTTIDSLFTIVRIGVQAVKTINFTYFVVNMYALMIKIETDANVWSWISVICFLNLFGMWYDIIMAK